MHFSTDALQQILDTWGYIAVFVFVAIESSGIPFPGETMLIVAAAYAGTGQLNIALLIAVAAAGAIIGDNVGYIVGRTGGREIALRYGKYVRIDEKKLDLAEEYFEKHGDKTVFFGRFIAVLRAWAAFLAGLNRMPWPKFLLFNTLGGICWATTYGMLAYLLGKNLPLLEKVVKALGYAGIAIAVLVVVAAFVLFRRRQKRAKQSVSMEEAEDTPEGASSSGPGGSADDADRDSN